MRRAKAQGAPRPNPPADIRPMGPDDYDGKAWVHYLSWQETYQGMLDAAYLEGRSLERCQEMARRWPERCLVAETEGQIVGFAAYGPCGDEDLPGCGEVFALYVLRAYQGRGIGRALMDACMKELGGVRAVALWVLSDNERAIRFYERCGFFADGARKTVRLGTEKEESRMRFDCMADR